MWTESWSEETGQTDSLKPVLLFIHGAEWRFSIVSVTRKASALLVRIALTGPDECELVVRMSGGYVAGATAKEILDAACIWLLSRGRQTRAVLDIGPGGDLARSVRRQR